MNLEGRIEHLVTPVVEAMGFQVVRVKMLASSGTTLQIMVERGDGAAAVIDDCARISRALGPVLDAEDAVPGTWRLEVSSAGLDRPLVRPEDFRRFAGCDATASVEPRHDGQRRFRGRLAGLFDGHVRLEQATGEVVDLPLGNVVEARLDPAELIGSRLRSRGPGTTGKGE